MSSESISDNHEEQTFEAAYQELEKTVQALESDGLSLDQATKLYEEGTRLAKADNELLSVAELRITRLQTSVGEQMRFMDNNPGAAESDEEDGD